MYKALHMTTTRKVMGVTIVATQKKKKKKKERAQGSSEKAPGVQRPQLVTTK